MLAELLIVVAIAAVAYTLCVRTLAGRVAARAIARAISIAAGVTRALGDVHPLRRLGALYGDTRRSLTCSGCGRDVPVVCFVTCGSCGFRTRRNAFAPCVCGATLRHLTCPHCRVSIPRPALWSQEGAERRYR